jgi:transposase
LYKKKELKENLETKDQIYFMDGCTRNTMYCKLWVNKKRHTKHLKPNNDRKRTNINGALYLETKEIIYVEDERINSQTMTALPLLILEKHPSIILKFLPLYSPNLNIIERLWHFFLKKVMYNKFHLKFSDFRTVIIDFFQNKNWLNDEFKKVLTDNFQIITLDFSDSYL